MVREGQLLSISPGLFLSSTLGYGSVKKVREAHCKATFNLCLWPGLSVVFACECLLQGQRPPLPPNFQGRWGGTTFSKKQCCVTYQDAYSKAPSSHPFSLILLGNILSLKKKVPGIVFFFFTGKGKQEDYMPCFVRTLRQQSLHDDHLFSFLKVKRTHNAVVSACF